MSLSVSEQSALSPWTAFKSIRLIDNHKLFVITGGPGSGKTTLLQELSVRGYGCIPEAVRQIIQEQVASGGQALPRTDKTLYTRMMLQRSITTFLKYTPAAQVTFADRGIPDTLCYARLIALPAQERLKAPAANTATLHMSLSRRRGRRSTKPIVSASRTSPKQCALTNK